VSNEQTNIQQPPSAPPMKRAFRMYPFQYVGIAIVILIPILALFGVFGESFAEIEQSNDDLRVEITYATRYRYKMINSLTISIENRSVQTLSPLTVEVSRDYVNQFSTVAFSPSETRVTHAAYEVVLQDVIPGAVRVVTVELQGENYGSHDGNVTVHAEEIEVISIPIRTLIFP
jgi:hypothetical protein